MARVPVASEPASDATMAGTEVGEERSRVKGRCRMRDDGPGSRGASRFARFARTVAHFAGHPAAFVAAALIIAVWAASGPLFGFGNTWQLVINTSTTIVTFLMVFIIQNTQNRDAIALHLKVDELIRATEGAHNALLDLEELGEQELVRIRDHYEQLASEARRDLSGLLDTGSPEVDRR